MAQPAEVPEDARDTIVNTALFAAVIFGGVAVVASLFRVIDTGWKPLMAFHVVAWIMVFLAAVLRRQLPFPVRAWLLIGLFVLLGMGGFKTYGLIGGGMPLFITASVLAALLLGFRAGLAIATIAITSIVIIGLGVTSGWISFDVDFAKYAVAPTSWVASSFGLFLQMGILVTAVSWHQRALKNSLHELTRHKEHLEDLVEERTRSLREEVEERKRAERKLTAQSKLFETALNSIDQGFVVWGEDDRLTVCNDRYRELWGYPKELLKPGTPHMDLLIFRAQSGAYGEGDPRELAQARYIQLSALRTQGDDYVTTPGGLVVRCRSFGVKGFGFVFTFTDITALKNAEKEIAEKEALLRIVLDSVPAGIRCFDKDDNYLFFNARYSELWDLPDGLLKIGDPLRIENLYLADRGDYGEGDLDELVESVQHALPFNLEPQHYERTTLKGRILDCHTQPTGLGGHVSIHSDITALKQAESEILKNQELMRSLADNLPELISLKDPQGHYTFVNKRFEEWIDRERQDVIGKTMFDIYSTEQATDFGVRDKEVMDSRSAVSWETDCDYPDGKTRPTISTRFPVISDSGEILGLGTIDVDMTDPKRTARKIQTQRDELHKLNDQKNKFFSIIGHDLKGPFGSVLGFTEVLATSSVNKNPEQVKEYAAYIHEAAQQVFKLLENLLEWSQLQMGGLDFEPGPVDIKYLIDANIELFAPGAADKGIELTDEGRTTYEAWSDVHIVDTIIRNLISNAIKFTRKGGTITITARQDEDRIEISITDSGIGMSAGKLAMLFDLGKQTSTFGTDGEAGTGLGLHLCSEMVEKLGGALTVESVFGQGSTVRFTVPVMK